MTEAGFPDERVFDILVVCSEAAANAIEHAPVKGQVEVRANLTPDRLEVEVEGPGEFQAPARPDERTARGLGLPLMARLTDHLALYSSPEGGTLVTLTFYRPGVSTEAVRETRPPFVREMLAGRQRDQAYVDALFDQSRSPLVLLDTRFNFIRVNEAYARVCNRPLGEFAGRNHFEMYPSDTQVLFEEVVRTKRPLTMAARAFVFPDHPEWGVTYWDWTLTPLTDASGEVDALLFALADVTQLHRRRAKWGSRLRWLLGEGLIHHRRAFPAFLAGSVVEVVLLFGLDRLGPPSYYLGVPGSAAALIAVLAAVFGGAVAGTAVGLVAGAAYFAFITDAGTTVLWPPIVVTIIILALAGMVAGAAGERIRARALERETLLSQSVAERQELLGERERLLEEERHLNLELQESYAYQRSQVERLEQAFLEVPGALPNIDSGHAYRSATEGVDVGGDFYDLIPLAGDSLAVLIGDVAGHGLDAARLATMVKDVVSALAPQGQSPGAVLESMNELLLGKNIPSFVTAFLGRLDLSTGDLTFASAGHPWPFYTDESEVVRALPVVPGPPLGVFAGMTYPERTVRLPGSGLLFLFTDGLVEARKNGTFYGETRLHRVLEAHKNIAASELPGLVIADVLRFTDGTLRDDLALLAVRYRPAGELAAAAG